LQANHCHATVEQIWRREVRDLKEVVAEIDAVVVRGDRQNLDHMEYFGRPDV
jgi:outer membrane receptor for ferrienterochelin and colicin